MTGPGEVKETTVDHTGHSPVEADVSSIEKMRDRNGAQSEGASHQRWRARGMKAHRRQGWGFGRGGVMLLSSGSPGLVLLIHPLQL